ACIALSLPGSSGAGALVKVKRDTTFGYLVLYASMASCSSASAPPTSVTLTTTGDFSAGSHQAQVANNASAIALRPALIFITAPYLRSSGAISFGRINGISGQMMMAASITSIGTSMIVVSLSANLRGTDRKSTRLNS